MGHVNIIWQGDANERNRHSSITPLHGAAKILNVTGPETVSRYDETQQFGAMIG